MIQTDKIYQILKILADNMNFERFDIDKISPQNLKITKSMCDQLIVMLNESGYIKGVVITEFIDGLTDVNIDKIKITLKGLEYLESNSIMQKAADIANGIIRIVK